MALTIELDDELENHFRRCKRLAEEADDEASEDTLSSRSQAMKTHSSLLENLIKMKKEAHNLQTLSLIEQSLIEVAKESFDDYQMTEFLKLVKERLRQIQQ